MPTLNEGPLAAYNAKVADGLIKEDKYQLKALIELQQLYEKIISDEKSAVIRVSQNSEDSNGSWFTSMFKANPPKQKSTSRIMGVYMWGGVGCGKTFVMDLFYDVLPIKNKRRVHFNNFMIDVHKRLHQIKLVSAETSKPKTQT